MISAQEAMKIVLAQKGSSITQSISLMDALGKVADEPLLADRDFPPYDRVTMDGIAIAFSTFAKGQKIFPIEGLAAAGAARLKLNNSKNAIEVMTGAVLPAGTDTVIRYEDIVINDKTATINIDQLKQGQNVHRRASDRPKGSVLMKAGELISANAIAVAATVGKSQIKVRSVKTVAILTTGDELVEIDRTPLAHQIRTSNSYAIQAALKEMQIDSKRYHVIDTQSALETTLKEILAHHAVVIISGGVSKGKFDFVPAALEAVGVKKRFHKVAQRPGKPFWFGTSGEGKVVFALPGNPVSSYMCTLRYVKPYLRQCLGLSPGTTRQVILGEDYSFKPALLYMLQVSLENTPGGFDIAHPHTGNGSGDFVNLIQADGFLELDAVERSVFKKGEVLPFWGW